MRVFLLFIATVLCAPHAVATPAQPEPTAERAPFRAPPALAPSTTEPEWVRRMDRADRLYRTGARMGTIGLPVMLTGIVVTVFGIDRGNPQIALPGLLLAFGGGFSVTYGGPVMLAGAHQMTSAAEQALQMRLPRGALVGGWVSFAMLGGLPSYAFAASQRRLVLAALDHRGLLDTVHVRVHPTARGIALSGTF